MYTCSIVHDCYILLPLPLLLLLLLCCFYICCCGCCCCFLCSFLFEWELLKYRYDTGEMMIVAVVVVAVVVYVDDVVYVAYKTFKELLHTICYTMN